MWNCLFSRNQLSQIAVHTKSNYDVSLEDLNKFLWKNSVRLEA